MSNQYIAALEWISRKCEQVANDEIHVDVAIFEIYASARQALKEKNK